jgi:hypothetical protein
MRPRGRYCHCGLHRSFLSVSTAGHCGSYILLMTRALRVYNAAHSARTVRTPAHTEPILTELHARRRRTTLGVSAPRGGLHAFFSALILAATILAASCRGHNVQAFISAVSAARSKFFRRKLSRYCFGIGLASGEGRPAARRSHRAKELSV